MSGVGITPPAKEKKMKNYLERMLLWGVAGIRGLDHILIHPRLDRILHWLLLFERVGKLIVLFQEIAA